MAEPVVSYVVEQLRKLTIEEAKYLHGVSEQIQQMKTELQFLKSFLRDADKRQDEDETLRTWISEIREAAYDVEYVINTFVLKIASRRGGSGILNKLKRYSCIFEEWIQLHKVGSEIESIKAKISDLTVKLQTYGIRPQSQGEGSSSTYIIQRQLRRTYSHYEEDVVVGFEEDVKILVAELVDKGSRVVSICGMGGLGKTHLAKKVYHHRDVRLLFHGFAWAYVSQQCQTSEVWKSLLIQLTSPSLEQRKEISELKDDELAEKLYKFQQNKKCLVILDDIWTTEAWDSIRPAFPLGDARSKILLTSRNREVALRVHTSRGFLHDLRFLDEKESWMLFKTKAFPRGDDPDKQDSWELLKKKAFPRGDDPVGLVEVGRKIVERCGGLPLAIVVLGGLLASKDTLTEWKLVVENVDLYLSKGHDSVVQKVLALSYYDLPYQLKPCFLYLSCFPDPEDNIPAKKLIRMWVAEGFVSVMQDEVEREENLEEIAYGYLQELINRCMVKVGKVSTVNGRIKTCYLHDLMRDLSISIAKQENFFNFLHLRDGNDRIESSTSMVSSSRVNRFAVTRYRKDNIRSPLNYEKSKSFHLRSVSLLKGNRIMVEERHLKSMFNKVRLPRVLDLGRITSDEDNAIRLLSSISDFGNLQILNLQFVGEKPVIPNVICKMEQLRHIYFPISWNSNGKLLLGNLRNLHTLVNFRADKCDVKDLIKLTNLRKLSLYSEDGTSLKKFVDEALNSHKPNASGKMLINLQSLSLSLKNDPKKKSSPHLYKLDIDQIVSGCPHLYKLYVKGKLEKLPSYEKFPSKITKLILDDSTLKEDPMPTLEKLPYLRILRLGWKAFAGQKMLCSKKGFPQLKSLSFNYLPDLEEWWVEEGAMPNLDRLEISDSDQMKYVPDRLKEITMVRD